MSRTVVPPPPTPEPGVPESADGATAGREAGLALGAFGESPAPRAGQSGAAGGPGAVAVDEPEDWDPPTPDLGEEDQSLDAPDDDVLAQAPYC